ncbi:MAG TPA: trypsin-like peptidase domain-containing protein [Planctomycetaceae bacterium]
MTAPLRIALVATVASSAALPAAAGDASVLAAAEERMVSLIEQVEPSVVSVVRGRAGSDRVAADRINPFGVAPGFPGGRFNDFPQFPQPGDPDFVPEQFGAGVVVADEAGNRFILTNHHVVHGGPAADAAPPQGDGPQVYVRFHDRRGYYAKIHASDPRSDLAVLRIDYDALGVTAPDGPDDFPRPLPLSDAEQYRKGQFVFVFGNPYGVARDGSASVGWGIIGNVLRRPAPAGPPWDMEAKKDETIHHYGTLLQLDCRTDLGFSGGATIDRDGKLIGITTALAAIEGYESTAGFAIPIDAGVRRLIDELLKGHEAEYGFLGVQPEDVTGPQLRLLASDAAATGGVRAQSVKSGSPADRAGLRAGDVVLAIDGRPVRTTHDLMRQIGLAGPGAEVDLDVVQIGTGRRGGGRKTVRVRLDKWPVVNDQDLVATVPRYEPWHGLRVDHATARQRFVSPQLEPYPQGVVVLSAAEPIGGADPIEPGDFIRAVNDEPVDTPAEFYDAVRGAAAVTLHLADGRRVTVE